MNPSTKSSARYPDAGSARSSNRPRQDGCAVAILRGVASFFLVFGLNCSLPAGANGAGAATIASTPETVTITLPNRVVINLLLKGELLRGMGKISADDVLLRGDTYLLRPLVDTLRIKGDYRACKYLGCEPSRDGVIVKSALVPVDPSLREDLLEWCFYPAAATVYRNNYGGFSYCYHFKSANQDKVQRIVDRTSWEIGGRCENLSIKECSFFKEVGLTLNATTPVNIPPTPRFMSYFDFNFQTSPLGTLFVYYRDPINMETSVSKSIVDPHVNYFDVIDINLKSEVTTTEKYVLFSKEVKNLAGLALEDEHTYVQDYVRASRFRNQGLQPPGVGEPMVGWASIREKEEVLKQWSDLGFVIVNDWYINDNDTYRMVTRFDNACGLACWQWYDGISPVWGGEDVLKYYVDRLKKHGMKLMMWAPGGHRSGRSPVVVKHPDWVANAHMEYNSRKPESTYYRITPCYVMDAASPDAANFAARYKEVHERSGLDYIFGDSFSPHVGGAKRFSAGGYTRMLPELENRIQQLYRSGVTTMTEGYTCGYALVSGGTPGLLVPPGEMYGYERMYKYERHYRYSDHLIKGDQVKENTWYMKLADGSGIGMMWGLWPQLDKKLQDWIGQANRDHGRVKADMQWRHLIPDPKIPDRVAGVEWRNDANDHLIIFSFGEFPCGVDGRNRVTDISAGVTVNLSADKTFTTAPYHTYVCTK